MRSTVGGEVMIMNGMSPAHRHDESDLTDDWEVIVVGGGSAGLSAALMLARSRRRVLVVDAGAPRNAPAEGAHGLLGREGIDPLELVARGRDEVRSYGGSVITGQVVSAGGTVDDFTVELADGRTLRARRLILAGGIRDELPDLPGLAERWGRDVIHCPYCHGWEVRDRRIAVLATSPMAAHQVLLFRQLSDRVTVLAQPGVVFDEASSAQFAALDVPVVEGAATAVEVADDRVTGVRLADDTVVPADAVTVISRFTLRAPWVEGLGLRPAAHPTGLGEHLPARDAMGHSDVPGVLVAGNVAEPMANVVASMASGAMAGAGANAELAHADAVAAVAARTATGATV